MLYGEQKIKGVLQIDRLNASIIIEDHDKKIEIKDKDFIDRMLRNIPCFVGGIFLYTDEVELIARLKYDSKEAYIESVYSGTIYRDGEGIYNL